MDMKMRNIVRFLLIIMASVLLLLSQSPVAGSAERFVDNGDGTVTDTRRKLMWQKDDNGEEVTFEEAQKYCRIYGWAAMLIGVCPKPEERETAVAIALMMPMHSRDVYARLISIGHPTPRPCSRSTITPLMGERSRGHTLRKRVTERS